MSAKLRKVLSLALTVSLLFQQVGFAQIATELNIASHLSRMASSLTVEKFRPLHLRYFSYDTLNDNFKVLLDKGDLKNLGDKELQSSTKTLLSYFLVGVTLPDSMFWVNLRPDSEDQIIDQYLEKTDVGKIMLEADLQLKKDTAAMTSPAIPEGREYWDKLYKKAGELYGYDNVTIPTLTRPWIVPGEIIVRESKDSAYVYKATLKVMLEQDYLKDSAVYNFKDERAKALNEYSSELIRELIIPKLTREVNSSKRYAPLRQVYYSLILSRWFKLRFTGKTGTYASLINTRNLSNLTSQEPWTKTAYFKQYQKSFKDGEYNIKEPVYTPTGQVIRSYFSGGINVASSAINTQNGIILPNDNANKLGDVIGGKAVVDLQSINLKLAVVSSSVKTSSTSSPVEKVRDKEFSAGSPIDIGSYLSAINEPIQLVVGGNREDIDGRSKAFIEKLVDAMAAGKVSKVIVGEDPQGIDMELIALMVKKGYPNKLVIVGIDNERRVTNEWWLKDYIDREKLTSEQVNNFLRAIGINRDISVLSQGDIERHLSSKGVIFEAVPQAVTKGMSPQEKHSQKGIFMVNQLGKGDLVVWIWTKSGESNSATFKHAGNKGLNRVIFRQQEFRAEFISSTNEQKKAKVEKLRDELKDILATGEFPVKLATQIDDSDGPVYIFLTNSSINKDQWEKSDERYKEAYIELDKRRFELFKLLLNSKNITIVFGDPRLENEEQYNFVRTTELASVFTHNGYRANQAEVWMYKYYLDLVKEGKIPQASITMVSPYHKGLHRVLYPFELADPVSDSKIYENKDVTRDFGSRGIRIEGHKNWPQGVNGQIKQIQKITYKNLPLTVIHLNLADPGAVDPNPRYSMRDAWIVENLSDLTIAFYDGLSSSVKWNFEQALAQDKSSILVNYRDSNDRDSLEVYNDKEWLEKGKESNAQKDLSIPSVIIPAGENTDVTYIFTDVTKVVFGGNRENIGYEEKRYTKEWAKIFARLDNIKEVYVGDDGNGLDVLLVDELIRLGKGAKLRIVGINNTWRLAFGRKTQLEEKGVKFISVPSARTASLPVNLQHRQRGLYMMEQLMLQSPPQRNPVVWVGTQDGPVNSVAFEYAANELKLPWILYLSKRGKVILSSSPIKIIDGGDFEAIEKAARIATAVDFSIRADQLSQEGKYQEAIDLYTQVINNPKINKDNPRQVETYFGRGMVRFNLNQYRGAIDDFKEAIKVGEESSGIKGVGPIYFMLGKAYEKLGQADNAAAAFAKVSSSSSSPMQSILGKTGGIDFRALPMTIQPMGSFNGLNFKLPQLSQAELGRINVNAEMQQIRNMVQSGIIPSGQRIKELIAACVQKKEMNSQSGNLLLCLADIFKLEEENVSESSPELREALVIVDSQG